MLLHEKNQLMFFGHTLLHPASPTEQNAAPLIRLSSHFTNSLQNGLWTGFHAGPSGLDVLQRPYALEVGLHAGPGREIQHTVW